MENCVMSQLNDYQTFPSALSDEEKIEIKEQLLLTFNEPVSQVILAFISV